MSKLNCWEFLKCGREPGGSKVSELGECPAAVENIFNGINSGSNGGRICWFISGTLCRGEVQGKYNSKLSECLDCGFYQLVSNEEGEDFKRSVNFIPSSFLEKINPEKIKSRILTSVTAIIMLFLAVLIFGAYRFQQWHINKEVNDKIRGIEKLFVMLVRDEAKLMSGRLEYWEKDKYLQRIWMNKNRRILYKYSAKLFEEVRYRYDISHYCFIEKNMNYFLMIHNSDYSGEAEKNAVTERAFLLKKPASGLFADRRGNLMLSVVRPWFIGGKLTGYMELAKEIDRLESKIKDAFGTELVFIIEKKFISRANRKLGSGGRDSRIDSDMPGDYIIEHPFRNSVSSKFARFFRKLKRFEKERIYGIDIDKKQYRIGFINLNEREKHVIGKIAVIIDVTGAERSLRSFMMIIFSVCVVSGAFLFLFYNLYLRRIELDMKSYHDNLNEVIAQRNMAEETLRESEGKFRLLSEQSLVGIVILQDNLFKYANQAMADILEYTIEELLNLPLNGFSELVYPDDRPLVMEQARRKQRGDKDIILNYTWRVKTKSGKVKWVETYSRTIIYKGRTANFVNMIDITSRRKAEEEQRNLQLQLIQSQKMESVGRLAGGIAHDFNNLLSIIIGYSDLSIMELEQERAGIDKLKKTLVSIREAGEKAVTLTGQLLAFSRKQVMEMKPVNLNRIVENMANMLRRIIREDISLVLNTNIMTENILADVGQIEQIIMNLTINARDAIKYYGSITIEISNVHVNGEFRKDIPGISPGVYVLLTVADTGTGMPEEIKEKIFEPFFTTKAQGQGTGLGLSVVYGIVKQHSGYICVDSESGKGSKFSIFFPAAEVICETAEKKDHDLMPHGAETILIAEDEKNIGKLLKETLEPLEYRLLMAANGSDALEMSKKYNGRIDLLLTDVIMPVMNGYELAKKIRISRPEIKIIYMSGYINDPAIHQYIIESDAHFIPKPISLTGLANMIRKVLDS